MTRQRLFTALKFTLGIALIVFLFTRLEDPSALWQQIVEADKRLLLLGMLCYSAAVALSGLKWRALLGAADIRPPISRLLAFQWQAEFFNNFLPAQVGGDVMRGYALAVDTRRKADAAASVLIDRFIGLFVFMVSAALASTAMLIWGRPDGAKLTGDLLVYMQFIAMGSLAASVGLLVVVVSLVSRRLKSVFERLLSMLPMAQRTVPIWQKLAQAFNVYRDKLGTLLLVAGGSVVIVVLTSINIWLIARAILPGGISLLEVLAINPIIVFVALAIPLSPGGLGVRQGAFVGTFLLVGASGQLGLAVGLLQQFIGYLVSLPGGYLWMRSGAKPDAVDNTLRGA